MIPANDLDFFQVVVLCLSVLIGIGFVALVIRVMMKPLVLLGVVAILGWILYLGAV
jgi:hypothetical protein